MRLIPYSFSVLLLLTAGFGAGWWMRGLNAELHQGSDTPVTPAAIAQAQRPPTLVAANVREDSLGDQPLQMGAEPETPAEVPVPQPEPPQVDIPKQFRALLDAQSFSAAMNLYTQVERRSSSDAAELKNLVMGQLEQYLVGDDGAALTGLVDAFLSYYYDDLDILLLLARYHLQAGYPSEAARTFQLAFTYAYAQTEQQKVNQAFQNFVRKADEGMAGQNGWQRLIGFYETLELLDLTQPLYQLRQAELYLSHGEPGYGRDLLTRLTRLTRQPAVAVQAAALLKATQTDTTQGPPSEPMDSIPLQVAGSHYHLPLRLNDAQNIHLLIDTGATTTTLSKSAFDAFDSYSGFTELGPQMFNTAGGVTKGTLYRVARFQLGNHVLSDVHIAVLDFNMPPGVDGLLGMNVLRHFRFRVDQDELQLHLRSR